MATPSPCVPCCTTPQTTNIPGATGASAVVLTTADFIIPQPFVNAGSTVDIHVVDNSQFQIGQNIFTGSANFLITALVTGNVLRCGSLAFPGDTAAGSIIVAGSVVSPGNGDWKGLQYLLHAIVYLTDSSGGVASNSIAAATNTATITDSTGGTPSTTFAAVPAGGTGAAAGGWDTAPHRDTAIASINNSFSEVAAQLNVQKALNTVLINAVASLSAKLTEVMLDLQS